MRRLSRWHSSALHIRLPFKSDQCDLHARRSWTQLATTKQTRVGWSWTECGTSQQSRSRGSGSSRKLPALPGSIPIHLADWIPQFDAEVAEVLQLGFGKMWPDIVESLATPAALGLRVNLKAISRDEMKRRLDVHGVSTRFVEGLNDMLQVEHRQAHECGLGPIEDAEVVVGRLCGEAVLNGAHVFVPGVLSCSWNVRAGSAVKICSDVDEVDTVGTPVHRLRGRRVLLGGGIACLDQKEILHRQSGPYKAGLSPGGVAVEVSGLVVPTPPAINGLFEPDVCFIQGLPPGSLGHILNPLEHRYVVDLCAAPGGKATHVAARLLGQTCDNTPGVVIACDRSNSRLARLQQTAGAWGLSNILRCVHGDGAQLPTKDGLTPAELIAESRPSSAIKTRGLKVQSWDVVLVDPPCSAIGLRPRLRHWGLTLHDVHQLVKGQRRLLAAAVRLLRPGGIVVYSTCTLLPQENEEVVAWSMEEFGLQLCTAHPAIGGPAWPGHGVPNHSLGLCRRSDPVGDMSGFFVAVLLKPD